MKKLFVIMPFGRRIDQETHRTIDFDFVYQKLIKTAAHKTNWQVNRIDEITKPGAITDQYLHEILNADVVLADISISNANVFYELGVRQAISSRGTILIAERNTKLPFDLSIQRVILYDLSSSGIIKGQQELIRWLSDKSILSAENPIRTFLEKIAFEVNPKKDLAAFEHELKGRIERANTKNQLIAVWKWAQNQSPLPPFILLELARKLSDFNEWMYSSEVLKSAVDIRPNDYELQREYGWHLSKIENKTEEALRTLEHAIELNPNDPETHGMIGGILKRLGDYTGAAEHYSKGSKIAPNNLYMLVNNAAMEILTNPDKPEKGIELYMRIISDIKEKSSIEQDEWDKVVLSEALFVIGDIESAKRMLIEAKEISTSPKSIRSARDQIKFFAEQGFNSIDAIKLIDWIEHELLHKKIIVKDTNGKKPLDLIESEKMPVIIHLSDLHFGYIRNSSGQRVEMHRFIEDDYTKPLSEHIKKEFSSKRAHFKQEHDRLHIAITGDLTSRGKQEEFQLVLSFLEQLCSNLDIPKKRVHIVLGNHDIDWDISAHEKEKRFDNYIGFLVNFYGESLFSSKFPFYNWDFRFDSQRPQPHKLIYYYKEESGNLLIVGMNSCIYETNQEHYGFIGGEQLDLVDDLVYDLHHSDSISRLALFHHHLHPFPEFIKSSDSSSPGLICL